MNLLHRAMLSQQQKSPNRQLICPVCGLPAIFTSHNPDSNGKRAEEWICGNCGTAMALSELWPIAPTTRVPVSHHQSSLPIPAFSKDHRQVDIAETVR